MSNWENILKVQVLDTTTSLSSINEPMMEDKNCCEQAKTRYKWEYMHIWHPNKTKEERIKIYDEFSMAYSLGRGPRGLSWLNNLPCEDFRSFLKDNKLYFMKRVLDAWEECENE